MHLTRDSLCGTVGQAWVLTEFSGNSQFYLEQIGKTKPLLGGTIPAFLNIFRLFILASKPRQRLLRLDRSFFRGLPRQLCACRPQQLPWAPHSWSSAQLRSKKISSALTERPSFFEDAIWIVKCMLPWLSSGLGMMWKCTCPTSWWAILPLFWRML